MQKVCATFLLIALVANYEALPQTKWSRPISSEQGQLTRERRQFAFGDWIPVNKPCPTCRPLIDPLDVAQRTTNIGLTPPRPPTVTRQVHGEGNFFPQDESSILSVPPPPPGTVRHGPNGNFQSFRFQGFPQQFNTHVPLPTQQVFPPSQQVQFLQQPFVANQNVLLNSNQQSVAVLNNQNALSGQENQGKQVLNSAKVPSFNADFKKQNNGESIVLQQNQSGRKLPFSGSSASFGASQQQIRQQTFVQQPQQQSFVQHHQQQGFAQQHQQPAPFVQQSQQQALIQQRPLQQQQSLNYDSILTPPPVANATAPANIVIPGLDKEEVQLLYVPVETLKHRGTLHHQEQQQQHVLTQQQQDFQFPSRQVSQQRQPAINAHSSDAAITASSTTKLLPGSFVASQRETLSTVKVSSPQPFSTASTPTTVFFQSLPLQQTPQPFVSATPIISTPSPFVTQSSFVTKAPSFAQTFSTLSPTTLSHFPTFQNSAQFKQYENQFVTTPKTLISEDGLREEIITGKPFESVQTQKVPFTQDQSHILLTSGQHSDRNPTTTTAQIETTLGEQQFQNQQLLLKSQQEQQLLLQQQKEKELKEEYLLKQRHQKEQEAQRLRDLQRLKELEQQAFLLKQKKQKELEEQKIREEEERQRKIELEQKRQKELEEERLLQQRQKQLEQERYLQQQRQKELERERYLQQQRQKELEEKQLEEERQRKIELEQKRQKELEEERLLQQRQKQLEQERYLQQQRQKELERERYLQQQRQKELEQERYLQQQRQKELERERYLQQQKEKEIEQERYLQEQKQKEMEKQLKINRLKELDERRLLQQHQKEEEEQRLHILQQQKEFEEQRLLHEQQERLRQQQIEQEHLLQQNLERQKQENAQKAQVNQFTQKQELNKHVTEQPNRHVFSEADDSNFISQAEKEVDPESLIPHQPPLSVFFRGNGESQPNIVDVLRELRSSKTIIVLDQYFEKMPKVFVGPAGLKPPLGYGKFELPYLSNIDNPIEVKIDKLPFFVAPLNFVPPPGYSKIPFPSPHVGSVVVSSELNPAMNLKATEQSFTVEGNDDAKNYDAVGPELPGLINGLEKEVTTTIKPTTSSLPQTTAQLRNRRPSNNLYRSRTKPAPKARSTTTPKPEETTQKPQREEAEGGFRRPFNRFLKRRRPTTTTTTTTESPQERDVESKQYSFQVQHRKRTRVQPNKPVIGQKLNHQQENQGFEKTSTGGQSHGDFKYNSDIYKIQSSDEKFKKQSHRLPEYADVNNIQTFEDGPIPTGSAKSITQEVYRPNDLRVTNLHRHSETQTKLQPKVDVNQNSQKIFEVPKPTSFVEDSEVNPTALYVETTGGRISTPDHFTLTPKSDSLDNAIPTTLSPNFYNAETAPVVQQHSTTENTLQDDRFTVAFAEISKHYHIPGPQETSKRYETKYADAKPTPEISHALQPPPVAEGLSQEQQPQLATLEEVKPTYSITDLENINSPATTSNEEFSAHFENEYKNSQNFSGAINEVRPTAPGILYSQQYNADDTTKSQSTPSVVAETEQPIAGFGSTEKVYSTPLYPTSPLEQYYLTSARVPIQDYITATNKSKTEENYYPATFETIRVSPEVAPTTPNYVQEVVSHSESLDNDNLHKIEDYSQTSGDVSSTTQGHKFSNPSIVKVRTRVRGRQRGSVNYASSQSSTSAPAVRTKYKNQFQDSDQEYVSKTNGLRNYNPVKTSKYSGFRGVKKPIVSSTPYAQTVEPTSDYDQKSNVYTIRPQRRPSNPSTVSTKRIRRPTSPFPTLESSTEGFGISTPAVYSQGGIETQEYPSSGVSNDVYYEHGNLSPVRHKLIKTQGLYEQAALKTVAVPSYVSTTPFPLPTPEAKFPPTFHETYSQSGDFRGGFIQETVPSPQPPSEKYFGESNLSDLGLDVSEVVLTTLRSTLEEDSSETEIPKKFQESKKAVDPDLEKKNGRRRIRVRVHKRPHENFETAESQNLRTVANVLVPPTSTYKPIDESGFHQLAKNSHPSYGFRSREYFKKKLNLTHLTETDAAKSREDSIEDKNAKRIENSSGEANGEGGIFEEHRLKGYLGKGQRKENEFSGDHLTENVPSGPGGEKFTRKKVRGFVRKIKKHGIPSRNITTSTVSSEDDDGELKQENVESHSRQHLKVNYGGSHQNGRFNGTRHRTIIKYIKKNRFRTHESEPSEQETEKGEQQEHKVTESHSSLVEEEQSHEMDVHTTQQTEPETNEEEELQTTLKNTEADEIITTQRTEALHSQEVESETTKSSVTEQSNTSESLENQQQTTENTEDSNVQSTVPYETLHTQRSDTIKPKIQATEETQPFETDTTEAIFIPTTDNVEVEKASTSEESSSTNQNSSEESQEKETEANTSTSSTQKTELKITNKPPKPFHSFRPLFQRTPSSGFIRTREPFSSSTTEHFKPESNERRFGLNRHKYEKVSSRKEEKSEEKKIVEHADRLSAVKSSFTPEIRKYSRNKSSFSSFSRSRYTTPSKVEITSEADQDQEDEFSEGQPETTISEFEKTTKIEPELDVSTKEEHGSNEDGTTQTFTASTEPFETTNEERTTDLHITTTALSTDSETSRPEEAGKENEKELSLEEVLFSTERKTELPTTPIQTTTSEGKVITTESVTEAPTTTEKGEIPTFGTQPNLYVFGRDSFSFDEAEKFTGTKNRAHVRNITADILENTARFSAPGIDKQNEIQSESVSGDTLTTTDISNKIGGNEKTEEAATTELTSVETTTTPPSTKEAVVPEAVTKAKIAKLVKTSTTTKISHETEICYRGKCIRTKSENPDEDLKLLVDSANVSLEKNKT